MNAGITAPHRTTLRSTLQTSDSSSEVPSASTDHQMHFGIATVSAIYMSTANSEKLDLVYHTTCAFVSVLRNRIRGSCLHIQHLRQLTPARKTSPCLQKQNKM
uniref:Uncharacterized protein n=1 Tax=Echinococcus granulosus TaxID=6210 RepID=A0A068X2N5_ECHGR|nr:hypothetical protein EgrG_002056800 [Echinococcus granulosus]